MLDFKAAPAAVAALAALAFGQPAASQTLLGGAGSAGGQGPDHLMLGVTAMATYDTNVARVSAADAALRGLALTDEIYTPTATVDVKQSFGPNAVFLSGTASYNFYARDKSLDRESLNLQGGLEGQLHACSGSATGSVTRGLNQLVDATLQQVEETFTRATVGADVQCGRPVGLAPTASVSETWGFNSVQALSASDAQTLATSGGLAYRTPASGTLTLSGFYQTTGFPNAPTVPGALKNGYTDVGESIKYERNLGARIQGVLSASYTTIHADGVPDFHGLTYTSDVTYSAGGRLQLEGSFSRSVIPSNLLNASYRVENTNLLQANYIVSHRLTWTVGASQQVGREGGAPIILQGSLMHYDQRSIFSSLTLALRLISLKFELSNGERTTNQAGLNYVENKASLSAIAKF